MFSIKPRLNPTQLAERRRQDELLTDWFAGQDIAFVDTWDGDRLTRKVLAASPDPADFQAQLTALSPETRRSARLTHVPDLDPTLPLPSIGLA